MFDSDVFVLGGGPAGLAAAIASRMQGLRVILADGGRPPIDKACGEGLMPDSLAAAARLGVQISPEHGFPFRGIRFEGLRNSVAADFPNGAGLGVRRPVLQRLFVDRAEQVGVEILWDQPVTGIDDNTISLGKRQIQARWIIGADGAQSSARRWSGLQHFRRDSKRFSYRRHFRTAPWSDYVEVHWGRGCQFYVTPVNAEEVCLVLMSRDSQRRISDALTHFPALRDRLCDCEPATSERGALAATRKLRAVTRKNVALIGDAAGTVDPITGEGLCLAFQQSQALAEALAKGDLAIYERAHAEVFRRPRLMSDFMLLMDRSFILQNRTLTAFESRPELFSDLLSMHVGQLPVMRFVQTAAALGWQVAMA